MIKLIVAVSHGDVIGQAGRLPWPTFSKDMAHFKEVTQGHVVIMGRKTWESLPASVRPLPGRQNVVLTRDGDYKAEGALIGYTLTMAIQEAEERWPDRDLFIIGGREIYEQAAYLVDELIITHIDKQCEGDTVFPMSLAHWEVYRQKDTVEKGVILSFRWYRRKDW